MARMSLHVHLKPYDITHLGIPHTNWANTVFKGVFMSKNYNLGFKSLTYLTACALNDKTPDMALVPDDEFFKIFELSKLHSVTSIVSLNRMASGIFLLRASFYRTYILTMK